MTSKLISAIALSLGIMAGCSSSVKTTPVEAGLCEHETRNKAFGITYNTERSRINCNTGG